MLSDLDRVDNGKGKKKREKREKRRGREKEGEERGKLEWVRDWRCLCVCVALCGYDKKVHTHTHNIIISHMIIFARGRQ